MIKVKENLIGQVGKPKQITGKISASKTLKGKLNTNSISGKLNIGIQKAPIKLVDLEVTPIEEQQIFQHKESDGYDIVIVNQIPSKYIVPEGEIAFKENGTYNIKEYEKVSVNVEPVLEDLVVTPIEKEQKYKSNKYGYNNVTIEAIPKDYIIPSGETRITENGIHTIREYETAIVNVNPKLEDITITPTEETQNYKSNEYGYENITVNPIPNEYIVPSGEKAITENGVYDIKSYESANINVNPKLEDLIVTPSEEEQKHKSNEYGYDEVIVLPIPSEYIIPQGELQINKNGIYDVREYENTNVEIIPKLQYKFVTPTKEFQYIEADNGYDGLNIVDVAPIPDEYVIPKLQEKYAIPSRENQTIVPDEGYDGLKFVDVSLVTSDIDKNIIPANIREGTEILGVVGTLKEGQTLYSPQYISWRQQDATDLTYEVSNIDSSRIISCMRMFDSCNNLTSLDLSSWTLESCNRLGYMFYNCQKLQSINMSNFDTKNVIYTNSMFYNCKALTSVDISYFNPISLTNVNAMFQNCTSLTEVDISSICTTKINNSALMFSGCTNLTKVIINSPSVFPMTNVSFFTGTPIAKGTGYVYVPDNLVETYKARTNWTTYADQIKPISELEVS